jgi:tetratricopeptide (TPR) repeat protein
MGWLLGEFGRQRLQQSNIVVPTRQFFPEKYDGSEVAARALFDRACVFMGADPAGVELVFHQLEHRPGLARSVVRPRLDWAGLFQFGEEKNLVRVDVTMLTQPETLLATFAHELAHQLLLGSGRICEHDPDHELVKDLSVAFFGMGIFNANDSLLNRYRLNRRGDEIGALGYLTPTTWGYALALCAWLRDEEKPAWAAWLRTAIRRVFRRSLAYLVRTGDARVIEGGQLDIQDRVSALSTEYLSIALAADLGAGEADSHEGEWDEDAEGRADPEGGPEAYTSPAESAELLLAASHHIEAGSLGEAQDCLDAVIRLERENGTAYQQRVWVLLELRMFAEALRDAELAVRLEPDDSESYRARGAACLKVGRFEQAVVDLTRYIAEEDTSTESGTRASRGYYMRGLAYAGLGDARKAIKDYDRAIRKWSDWPEPYEARAEAYELLGDSTRARADRDEARRRAAP